MWSIQAVMVYYVDGWLCTKHFPTFFLHGNTAECDISANVFDIINAFRVPNSEVHISKVRV